MKTTILALIFPLLNSISIYCQVKQCEGEYARKNSYDVTNISDTILVGGWASLYLSFGEKYLFNKKIDLHEGYVSKIDVIDSSIYLGISKNESNYPNPSIIVFNRNLNKKHELFLDKIKGVFVTEIIKCDSNLLIGTDNDLILYSLNTNKSKRINVPIKDTYKNTNKSKQQYIGAILEWNDSLIIAINSLIYIADKNMGYKRFLFNCKSLEYDPSYGDNSYYIKSLLSDKKIYLHAYICNHLNINVYIF